MKGWSARSWPQAWSLIFTDLMYSLRRCSLVRATSNPLFSLVYVGSRGSQGKVSPTVKMVTTPREKISMLASYFDISLLDLAGAKASGGM